MFGRFVAPLDGVYIFHLSASNPARLWMTIDGRRRLRVDLKDGDPGEWVSAEPVTLRRGESYALEAAMLAGAEMDFLAVGATFPDARIERPLRASRFQPPPPGTDFDADSDGDLLSDYEEAVVGTDPRRSSTAGDETTDFEKVFMGADPHQPLGSRPPIPLVWLIRRAVAVVAWRTFAVVILAKNSAERVADAACECSCCSCKPTHRIP
jgi:hypothetical protein